MCDPRAGPRVADSYVASGIAAVGDVIERHRIDVGLLPAPDAVTPADEALRKAVGDETPRDTRFRSCPKCFSPSLIHQEGCDLCPSCGYSKCA